MTPALVPLLAAALAVAPGATAEVVEVSTPAALLDALGPHRTVRLAPGAYDLATVAGRPATSVAWEDEGEALRLVVHDLDGLRVEGPVSGVAVLSSSRPLRLAFRRVSGLVLRDLSFGEVPRSDRWGDPPRGLEGPDFEEARDVTLTGLHALGSGYGPLFLRKVDGLSLTGLRDDGGFRLELYGARGVRVADARVRLPNDGPWIAGTGSNEVALARVEWEAEAGPASRLTGRVVEPEVAPSVVYQDVRLIDRVTGKVRREISGPPARPEAPAADVSIPAVLVRRRVSEDADGIHYAARLRLADGRVAFDIPADRFWGLEPSSVAARRLGGGDGPVLVTWTDQAQGAGAYQSGFYRILGPAPEDGVLLQGGVLLSGHSGWDEAEYGRLEFGRIGDLLLLSRSVGSIERSDTPFPGAIRHHSDEIYQRSEAEVIEATYRWTGSTLVPVRFERCRRIEPAEDIAIQPSTGWVPSVPHPQGRPPDAGDWLRRELSPAEGLQLWPAMESVEL